MAAATPELLKKLVEAQKKKLAEEQNKIKNAKAALTKLKGSVAKVDQGLKAEAD